MCFCIAVVAQSSSRSGVRRLVSSLGRVTHGCRLLCGCWELNLDPLQEQYVLLTNTPAPPCIKKKKHTKQTWSFLYLINARLKRLQVLSNGYEIQYRNFKKSSHGPPHQLLSIYPKDSKQTHPKHLHLSLTITAAFTAVKLWDQPRYPT